MGRVSFGDSTIEFRVEHRAGRRTVKVAVDPAGRVVVTAPAGVDVATLGGIVKKRGSWILDQRARFAAVARPPLRQYVSGESFAYLGRSYRLMVRYAEPETGCQRVKLERGQFLVGIGEGARSPVAAEAVRQALRGWYVEHAAPHILGRTYVFARQFGAGAPRVTAVDQNRRWGSCDKRGSIRINWRIIMAPYALVDYLCAHEACHLVVPDHSAAFWRRLAGVMPDYEKRREQLRLRGPLFDLPEPGRAPVERAED
jgi:predicted metal-dependent hydrolase